MPRLPTHMGNQKHAFKEDLDIVTAIIDVTRNWSRHQRFWDATDGRSSSLVYKYAMAPCVHPLKTYPYNRHTIALLIGSMITSDWSIHYYV